MDLSVETLNQLENIASQCDNFTGADLQAVSTGQGKILTIFYFLMNFN